MRLGTRMGSADVLYFLCLLPLLRLPPHRYHTEEDDPLIISLVATSPDGI